ncbi:MAG: BCD family MFS transporter [Synechococcaceae cyanobacterium]|nr:BCD family MFS transporter [Synechococcaceae cyanobacterium]
MSAASQPGLPLITCLRLGLFQACLGCLAVIFSGLINRIMLTELAFPGLLVGGALAFEQFVAPARVLFGQFSDAHAIAGRKRVPYVLFGTALFCGLAVLSVPLIFRVATLIEQDRQPFLALGISALCGLFACYGLAVSLASTPYLALVIDRTSEQERPRAVGIIWCMLTVGIVVGAIAISISLRSLDGVVDPALLEPVLLRFMAGVAAVVMLLTVVSIWGVEPASDGASQSGHREDGVSLAMAWRLVTCSGQVLIFFGFLVLFTLSLFLQDPILESYGAQIFGMPIAATARLNAFWGLGTLVGLLLAGLWIVPRVGRFSAARFGCQLIALSLLLLILCGLSPRVVLLQLVLLLFGLAAGIGTNSALCLMLDLTLPQACGTFVGVWGLGQALSRALGKLLGGGLLDLGRLLTGGSESWAAFALVFVVELGCALAAIALLSMLSLRQFREDTGRSLERVLAAEIG